MNMSKELTAATAVPIILAILQLNSSYGYAIIQKVREISNNEISWSDGMLYPVLHRLENEHLITSYWQSADTGRRRKYYQITDAGNRELEQITSQWSIVQHALDQLEKERSR